MRYSAPVLLAALPAALLALPPEPTPPAVAEPEPADGTTKALQTVAGLRPPAGMKVELFAAEPHVASPVALCLDEKGRVYVAEEFRFNRGTEENRSRSFLLADDLRAKTLDDRLAMYRKFADKFDGGMGWFTKHADRVRRLEDADGDGRAETSAVFAGGFNAPLDGLAAGVLARDGDVYVTCVPSLYKLRDTEPTTTGADRKPLLTGFGVSCAFLGHDLHGLTFGPDGRLYFSVGDRGFNVTSKEGTNLVGLRTGAVFRCEPDGSNLEVVMRGLRNPQELAFDQFGNLFADDNNCDRGDHARLVYVAEDGDAGWHMEYQTIPDPYTAGPWFAERLWHLPHAGQAAYVLPPVGQIGTGPSGLLFTSGTSLPARYKDSFLMCNYAGGGGLESFKVVPKGAGFETRDYHTFLSHPSLTDAEFGPDGKLYVSDFVGLDWTGASKGGRVYTVSDPEKLKSPVVRETKKLFAEGFKQRSSEDLFSLMSHPDQRVRLRAQWALADRNPDEAWQGFATAAVLGEKDQLFRIHCVWGLGQVGRKSERARDGALGVLNERLLKDQDPVVRAQAARVVGELKASSGSSKLIDLLTDSAPRVRFFAAQSLGRLEHKPAVAPLFAALAANADADPFLRHACVAALARIGDAHAVAARANDPSAAVRLAVVLVQRRLGDKRIAAALADADPLVRTEAARAVHDLPPDDLLPELAKGLGALKSLPPGSELEPLARRAINACFRLGTPDHLRAVLAAASDSTLPAAVRADAVAALREWADPPPRDRVTGFWRPLPVRDVAEVRAAVAAGFEPLLSGTTGALQTAVVGLIRPLGLPVDEATFSGWVNDPTRDVPARVAALRVLADRKAKSLPAAVETALAARQAPLLRAEARDVVAAADPRRAADLFSAVVADREAPAVERQRAVAGATRLKRPEAAALLDQMAADLAALKTPPELRLDVWEALKAAPSPARTAARATFEATLPPGPHRAFAASLDGGDADRGRDVFFGHATAQCVRCHKANGTGGTAGPDLTGVAARHPADAKAYFLQSLLDPSAVVAPGFATVTLTLYDGRVLSGALLAGDAKSLTIQTADGKKLAVAAADVEVRSSSLSPMPSMEKTLTPREVRDVIAYLLTLR